MNMLLINCKLKTAAYRTANCHSKQNNSTHDT